MLENRLERFIWFVNMSITYDIGACRTSIGDASNPTFASNVGKQA